MSNKKFKKKFIKMCGNILLSLLFVFIIINTNNSAYATSPAAAANSAASQVNSFYSGGNLSTNAINPMLNSGTPMTTVNGATSFNAQVSCPSSSAILQLNFLPSSSGDFELLIAENSNPAQDSSFNYQTTVPLISGVCTDGYIACDAGTWNNCKYYQWAMNGSDISWQREPTLTNLGTCFCVNNSCGGIFDSAFKNIASTIGGGISMLVSENDDMAISNATFNMQAGYQLSYYGQSSTNCQTVGNSSGYVNPQQYYNNPAGLTNAAQTESASQYSDTSSPYYTYMNNEANKTNPVSIKTCSVEHSVSINVTTTMTNAFCPAGTNWDYLCGHNCSTIILLNGCFNNAQYSHNSGTTYANIYLLQCPSGYSLSSQDYVANGSVVSFPDGDGWGGTWTIDPSLTESNACLEYVYTPVLSQDNTCQSLENNATCKLQTEEVCDYAGNNCVDTVQNSNPTGITPQNICETVNNPTVSTPNFGSTSLYYWNVFANGSSISFQSNIPTSGTLDTSSNNDDYWIVKKTYACNTPSGDSYNFSEMENRTNTVSNSLNSTAGSSYSDTEYNSQGQVQNISGISTNYSYTNPLGNSPCVYSCEVQNNAPNSAALDNNSGTTSQALNGTTPQNQTNLTTILTCTQNTIAGNNPSNSNWTCPATSGETIVKQCQCLNESNYALATASVLGSVAQDMICSAN